MADQFLKMADVFHRMAVVSAIRAAGNDFAQVDDRTVSAVAAHLQRHESYARQSKSYRASQAGSSIAHSHASHGTHRVLPMERPVEPPCPDVVRAFLNRLAVSGQTIDAAKSQIGRSVLLGEFAAFTLDVRGVATRLSAAALEHLSPPGYLVARARTGTREIVYLLREQVEAFFTTGNGAARRDAEPASQVTTTTAAGYRECVPPPGENQLRSPSSVAEAAPPLETKVREWYVEEWVPENVARGYIPERSECEAAARQRFGGGEAVRKLVRGARTKHAPDEWKRTGPKGLHRKAASNGN